MVNVKQLAERLARRERELMNPATRVGAILDYRQLRGWAGLLRVIATGLPAMLLIFAIILSHRRGIADCYHSRSERRQQPEI